MSCHRLPSPRVGEIHGTLTPKDGNFDLVGHVLSRPDIKNKSAASEIQIPGAVIPNMTFIRYLHENAPFPPTALSRMQKGVPCRRGMATETDHLAVSQRK